MAVPQAGPHPPHPLHGSPAPLSEGESAEIILLETTWWCSLPAGQSLKSVQGIRGSMGTLRPRWRSHWGPPLLLLFPPVWEAPLSPQAWSRSHQDSAELLLILYTAIGAFIPSGSSPSRDLGLCTCRNVFVSERARTVVSIPRAKGRISPRLFLLWETGAVWPLWG